MATSITRLLHHLALFLLLVQFQFADAVLIPNTKNKNHAALNLKPRSSSTTTYIVHADGLAKPPHFGSQEEWYRSMVTTHASSTRAASSNDAGILYTYDTVMHGFAVQLTGDEARLMSNAPGVIGVHEDRPLRLLTTRTPAFIGLYPDIGAWHSTNLGDGVIIGFVDSGIWPESPSFTDDGLGPVRSSWRGKCVDAHDFNASLCNNKLVGAKVFAAVDEAMRRSEANSSLPLPSPRDTFGHGTHVASTAAGSAVRDIGIRMFAGDTAMGVAPKARIAMYKVTTGTSDIVAAIDAEVNDGVDIISISMRAACIDDKCPFYDDSFAIATFGAVRAGVFVVLAAGNDGPQESTVINAAPWVTTVGAATVDRLFPASLRLGDGSMVPGQSLYSLKKANGTDMAPLVSNACSRRSLTPDRIMGKIVVCLDSDKEEEGDGEVDEDEDIVVVVQRSGAAGLVLEDAYEDLSSDEAALPSLILTEARAQKLRSYLKSVPNPTAPFNFAGEASIAEIRATMVAGFSSRGPNPVVPDLLKPDLVAPGHNIVAAWRLGQYETESGTSMACPHVAGVAALIKKKHPSWTPAMVRSALMTTAGGLDNTEREILDNGVIDSNGNVQVATPFATGAGHVRPQLALDPGLIYDASTRDYVDFLCALNYTAEQMRLFVPDFAKCTGTLAAGPAGLNYPSFVVVFANGSNVRTLTRTVTKVSEEPETYNVTVVAPEHVKVTVMPTTLEFKEHMETRSYSVEFRNVAGGNREAGGWDFGQISWENGKHQVRSPVAFQWKN